MECTCSCRVAWAGGRAWSEGVTRRRWRRVCDAWGMVGAASDVRDALLGGETEIFSRSRP